MNSELRKDEAAVRRAYERAIESVLAGNHKSFDLRMAAFFGAIVAQTGLIGVSIHDALDPQPHSVDATAEDEDRNDYHED